MKNKDLLLVSFVMGILYLVLLVLAVSGSIAMFAVLAVIFGIFLIPHIFFTVLALIFTLVGWGMKARWGAFTAGVLYIFSIVCVSITFQFWAIPFMAATMTLCFAGYALMPRDIQAQASCYVTDNNGVQKIKCTKCASLCDTNMTFCASCGSKIGVYAQHSSNTAIIVTVCAVLLFVLGCGCVGYELYSAMSKAVPDSQSQQDAQYYEYEKNNSSGNNTSAQDDNSGYTEDNSGGDDGINPEELLHGTTYQYELSSRMEEALDREVKLVDTAMNTLELVDGYKELYDAWDRELNIVYKKVMGVLPADRQKQLKKEEEQWVSTKNKNAKAAANEFEGGSYADVAFIKSKLESTKERTFELASMYDNYTDHSSQPQVAENGIKCMINGTNVNMREYPDTNANVVYKFKGYETVYADQKTNAEPNKYPWYRITYGNCTGWVYGQFIK
ncbi:MAG: lysozyme inhibitor LprI family protein [Synergistes sp.]|nr:lysozyme inhibitor LprI family protein [Synergistes sp.]